MGGLPFGLRGRGIGFLDQGEEDGLLQPGRRMTHSGFPAEETVEAGGNVGGEKEIGEHERNNAENAAIRSRIPPMHCRDCLGRDKAEENQSSETGKINGCGGKRSAFAAS